MKEELAPCSADLVLLFVLQRVDSFIVAQNNGDDRQAPPSAHRKSMPARSLTAIQPQRTCVASETPSAPCFEVARRPFCDYLRPYTRRAGAASRLRLLGASLRCSYGRSESHAAKCSLLSVGLAAASWRGLSQLAIRRHQMCHLRRPQQQQQ